MNRRERVQPRHVDVRTARTSVLTPAPAPLGLAGHAGVDAVDAVDGIDGIADVEKGRVQT
ncbi:hypothetical protein JL475_21290 [Streptomyces sp. M2CJ-2]|uniref:hypothetical protein n=1 Tax=Streptomyces sp. M2CJ-2 TaxID=2803948 RepID=UPI001926D040|nr:hypothetical protein [Streptomyces sp. M2CJ-2]MBL3668480.1 hypothetical protein [Streptomyces sp. M2CJ-2]